VQLVVAVRYLPAVVDVQDCVVAFARERRGGVDPDRDGEAVLTRERLEAGDEGGGAEGLAEGGRFGGRRGDIVGCFREE